MSAKLKPVELTHSDKANRYIDQVLSGVVPACKFTKQACQRQLDDLARKDFEYHFDLKLANRICLFTEMLPHIKGALARKKQLIVLGDWQCFVLSTVFGWVSKETGLRRFKTVYEELARKNGKSTKLSAVGLYLLAMDEEEGAEVYSCATVRDQAKIIWQDSKRMVDRTPEFAKELGVTTSAHTITVDDHASVFKTLSKDQGGNHDGLNTSGALIDELHAHKTREMWDVMETSTGAREQPLIWSITTAGFNRAGICYELRDYAIKVLNKVHVDEEFFSVIYTVDDDDLKNMDVLLSDENIWRKANPNWAVSVRPDDMQRKARKAREVVSAQNNFLTKHLCVWTNADTAWMSMAAWDQCADPSLDLADFEGMQCFKGTDLASKIDIASDILLFPTLVDGVIHYTAFDRHYLPEEQIENSSNSQYQGWEEAGFIKASDGNIIDFDLIEEDYLEDSRRFGLQECGIDPHQATQFSTRLMKEGIPIVHVAPTVLNFSEPMKQLEALVISGRFHHTGSPVLTWMCSNVVCHYDKKENVYPNKSTPNSSAKIDGIVALLMALNRAMAEESNGDINGFIEAGITTL